MPKVTQFSDEAWANTRLRAYTPRQRLHTFGAWLTDAVLELIFPPACAGCGRVDSAWCPRCNQRLGAVPTEILVQDFQLTRGEFKVVSTGWHTDLLQTAIQALKYENLPQLAQPLGERLACVLDELSWPVEVIIPVPLHAARLRARGYNQAALLAEALGAAAEIAVEVDGLYRIRDTRSQVGLNRGERLDNMAEAFHADEGVHDQAVLLIDDVATTGATLCACAEALYAAGASAVYALTVSAALGSLHLHDLPAGDQYTFDNRATFIR